MLTEKISTCMSKGAEQEEPPPEKKAKDVRGKAVEEEKKEEEAPSIVEETPAGFGVTAPIDLPDSIPAKNKKAASKGGKKCAICNGDMDYYSSEKKWQCFVCGHEE
jgi:hypothetical protein